MLKYAEQISTREFRFLSAHLQELRTRLGLTSEPPEPVYTGSAQLRDRISDLTYVVVVVD